MTTVSKTMLLYNIVLKTIYTRWLELVITTHRRRSFLRQVLLTIKYIPQEMLILRALMLNGSE